MPNYVLASFKMENLSKISFVYSKYTTLIKIQALRRNFRLLKIQP